MVLSTGSMIHICKYVCADLSIIYLLVCFRCTNVQSMEGKRLKNTLRTYAREFWSSYILATLLFVEREQIWASECHFYLKINVFIDNFTWFTWFDLFLTHPWIVTRNITQDLWQADMLQLQSACHIDRVYTGVTDCNWCEHYNGLNVVPSAVGRSKFIF